MRYAAGGLGLLGLLIAVGIAMYLYGESASTVAKTNKVIQPQANQITGRGPDAAPASSSVTLDAKMKNGKTEALLVTGVTAGGALDQYFSLQVGDEIVQVGDFKVKDLNDDAMAEAMVFEAAQRGHTITVRRGGQLTPLAPKGPMQTNPIRIPTH